jgi:hypothetical protein
MSAFEQLKALTRPDRHTRLEEIVKEDIQRLWKVYAVLGYTDDEIGFALKNGTELEFLRRYVIELTDEAVRKAGRPSRNLR